MSFDDSYYQMRDDLAALRQQLADVMAERDQWKRNAIHWNEINLKWECERDAAIKRAEAAEREVFSWKRNCCMSVPCCEVMQVLPKEGD